MSTISRAFPTVKGEQAKELSELPPLIEVAASWSR